MIHYLLSRGKITFSSKILWFFTFHVRGTCEGWFTCSGQLIGFSLTNCCFNLVAWMISFFCVLVPIKFWKQLLPHLARAVSWLQKVVPKSVGKSVGTCSESRSCLGSKWILLVLIYLHCGVYSALWHPAQPTGYSEDTDLKAGYAETIKNKRLNKHCRHSVAGKPDWNELFKKVIFSPGL